MQTKLGPVDRLEGCSRPCCNGERSFFRKESLTNIPMPTLRNRIHPVFAREKLACLYSRLQNPAIIDHTLQLATMLIEASLPFWHSLLFGEMRMMEERQVSEGRDGLPRHDLQWEIVNELKYTDEKPEALTLPQQVNVRIRLIELAAHITYVLIPPVEEEEDEEEEEEEEEREEDGNAWTVSKDWIHSDHDSRADFFNGRRSVIQLEETFAENFARHQHLPDTDPLSYQWCAFATAITLVHELAHAAEVARRPVILGDGLDLNRTSLGNLYFENAPVSETGFEWESRTLGGMINRSQGPAMYHNDQRRTHLGRLYEIDGHAVPFPGMICTTAWPDPDTLRLYEKLGESFGTRKDSELSFDLERQVGRSASVCFEWVQRLFRRETWEGAGAGFRGYGALWPRDLVWMTEREWY